MTTKIMNRGWRGEAPPAGDPGAERFTAALGSDECAGCLFEGDNAATCRRAVQIAVGLDLPDCDDRAPGGQAYIYVLDKIDPRQIDLVKMLKSTESDK